MLLCISNSSNERIVNVFMLRTKKQNYVIILKRQTVVLVQRLFLLLDH